MHPEHSPLGKRSAYIDRYTPELLFPIARKVKRDEIHVPELLPFYGYDLWNAFELSWLDSLGKPVVATAVIIFPADSDFLIESKSLKLYFNSFNQTAFNTTDEVKNTITSDLSKAVNKPVSVNITLLQKNPSEIFSSLEGVCLDELAIQIDTYQPNPNFLVANQPVVTETVHSHLLKSNCLVTGQPDWGSVEIHYTGPQINHAGLLKYIVSFRGHNEFHEQCVERIFMDILTRCNPSELSVFARYTRRGGLDINPYRSTSSDFSIRNPRLTRQ
jgi:7-cyano-7-deazaguanine reductase